jgi:hypothetical protein
MTLALQLLLFLSSYSPLLAVFALLDTFGRGWPSLICLVLAVAGVVLLPALFIVDRRTSGQTLRAASASPRDSDVLAYVASYLVPFADFGAEDLRKRLAIIIFLALIAILYIRLQLFYVNPLLALVGYRTYQVTTTGGTSVVLITHRSFIPPGRDMQAIRLSDYVWRERNHESPVD